MIPSLCLFCTVRLAIPIQTLTLGSQSAVVLRQLRLLYLVNIHLLRAFIHEKALLTPS